MIKTFKFKKEINLYCFTDVNIGSKFHDGEKFQKAITALKNDPNGYCFFNGDNLEFTPGGYHGATNEQSMTNTEQVQSFIKLIKSLGKKVLFVRTGNHEARMAKLCDIHLYNLISETNGITTLHRGMEEIHIYIGERKYRFVSTHGEGGNSKRALSNMQQTFVGADVYFTGHTHEMYVEDTKTWVDTSSGKEQHRNMLLICGGSFSGWQDYARSKNMVPTRTGCYILTLNKKQVFVSSKIG